MQSTPLGLVSHTILSWDGSVHTATENTAFAVLIVRLALIKLVELLLLLGNKLEVLGLYHSWRLIMVVLGKVWLLHLLHHHELLLLLLYHELLLHLHIHGWHHMLLIHLLLLKLW